MSDREIAGSKNSRSETDILSKDILNDATCADNLNSPAINAHGVGKRIPEIAAVIPAYNEEVAIGSVVLETKKYADTVVVVDD